MAVDADTDPVRLRARHPDRHSIIVVPALVRIVWKEGPAQVAGWIQEIPSSIHVPQPFSDGFRRLPKDRSTVHYQVHVRYGASYEPWIVGVDGL